MKFDKSRERKEQYMLYAAYGKKSPKEEPKSNGATKNR